MKESSFDVAPPGAEPYREEPSGSVAALLALFDRNYAKFREALADASDESLMKDWSLLAGGKVIFTKPRIACLRGCPQSPRPPPRATRRLSEDERRARARALRPICGRRRNVTDSHNEKDRLLLDAFLDGGAGASPHSATQNDRPRNSPTSSSSCLTTTRACRQRIRQPVDQDAEHRQAGERGEVRELLRHQFDLHAEPRGDPHGKYSHLNGVPVFNHIDGSQPMLQKYLQQAGYHTGMVGKWHLGGNDPKRPTRASTGFDYWNILPGQGAYFDPVMIEMGERKKLTGYTTDVITDIAIDFLKNRPREKPFFLMYHHKARTVTGSRMKNTASSSKTSSRPNLRPSTTITKASPTRRARPRCISIKT